MWEKGGKFLWLAQTHTNNISKVIKKESCPKTERLFLFTDFFRELRIQHKLEIIIRAAFGRSFEFRVFDLFQHLLEHFVFGLSRRQLGIDLKELFNRWHDIQTAGSTFFVLSDFGGKGLNTSFGSGDLFRQRPGTGKESFGIIHALLQQIVGAVKLFAQSFQLGISLFEGFVFQVKEGLLLRRRLASLTIPWCKYSQQSAYPKSWLSSSSTCIQPIG